MLMDEARGIGEDMRGLGTRAGDEDGVDGESANVEQSELARRPAYRSKPLCSGILAEFPHIAYFMSFSKRWVKKFFGIRRQHLVPSNLQIYA